MNRIHKIAVSIILILSLCQSTALAASYTTYTRVQSIPSVKITVDTGSISTGDMLSDNAESYISIPENDYYTVVEADWIDEVEYLKVGDAPRIRVYLNAFPKEADYSNYTKIWLFQGGYSASNVRVTGGEYVSSSVRDSGYTLEVTLRVKAVKGQFEAPQSVYWESQTGMARWEPSEYGDSGVYDVICYRNSTAVKKLSYYQGTSYNFYPYMTKEGDYSFKVRCAVPTDLQNTGKSSEYVESNGLYVTKENVSDGTGQTTADEHGGSASHQTGNNYYPNGTGNENVAGWLTDSTGTYFRYPDGSYAPAGWLRLNGSWYYLDAKGRMLSGWQADQRTGAWYYMDPQTGIMRTGWLSDGGQWYYLNTAAGSYEGCMLTGWQEIDGLRYYFNSSGIMVTGWFQIDGKCYYFYPAGSQTGGRYGYMAQNTRIGDFQIGADGTWQN